MLVKRSSKNQVALPKALLDQAGLGPEDVYFKAEYDQGAIILRPVEIDEKIPPEAIARLKARIQKEKRGSRAFSSAKALIKDLKRSR